MAKEPSKTVHFFRLALQTGRSVTRAETTDWAARLHDHLEQDVAGRMMHLPSGARLVTEAVPSCSSQVILGKVLDDQDFGLRRGSIAGAFEVVGPKDADEFFVRVNYVQYIEGSNAFALIGGAGDVPSSSFVEVLAEALAAAGNGRRWVVEPIMSEPEIERFSQTGAIKSVTTSVSVAPPDLFAPDPSLAAERPADLYSWSQAVSAERGSSALYLSETKPTRRLSTGGETGLGGSRARPTRLPGWRFNVSPSTSAWRTHRSRLTRPQPGPPLRCSILWVFSIGEHCFCGPWTKNRLMREGDSSWLWRRSSRSRASCSWPSAEREPLASGTPASRLRRTSCWRRPSLAVQPSSWPRLKRCFGRDVW